MSVSTQSDNRIERKAELLFLARRSRAKWISDASDPEPLSGPSMSSDPQYKNNCSIPAAECIQSVLSILSHIVNDGEYIDVHSIVSLLPSFEEDFLSSDTDTIPPIPSFETTNSNQTLKTPYSVFLEKLKHVGGIEVVKAIQQFVAKFEQEIRQQRLNLLDSPAMAEQQWTAESLPPTPPGSSSAQRNINGISPNSFAVKQSESIWLFLEHIGAVMKENYLWSCETEEQWQRTKGCVEKFLFKKLYPCTFATDDGDDALDEKLSERIASLAFLTPEHLDIRSLFMPAASADARSKGVAVHKDRGSGGALRDMREGDRQLLMAPIGHLAQLPSAHCPADKLLCLKRCSVSIAQALKEARSNRDGSLPGADEFLPMMILVVKECNPKQLNSTIKYLQRYTHTSKLVSEAGYLLPHFVSAVHFLENVDALALTISPEEFEQSLVKCTESSKNFFNKKSRTSASAVSGFLKSESSTLREIVYDEDDVRWKYFGPLSPQFLDDKEVTERKLDPYYDDSRLLSSAQPSKMSSSQIHVDQVLQQLIAVEFGSEEINAQSNDNNTQSLREFWTQTKGLRVP